MGLGRGGRKREAQRSVIYLSRPSLWGPFLPEVKCRVRMHPTPTPRQLVVGERHGTPEASVYLQARRQSQGASARGPRRAGPHPLPLHTLRSSGLPRTPLLEPIRKNGSVMPGRMDRKRVRRNQEVAQTLCPVQLSEPLTPHLRSGPGGLGRRRQRGCGRGSEGRAPPAQSTPGTRRSFTVGLGGPHWGGAGAGTALSQTQHTRASNRTRPHGTGSQVPN